MEFWDAMTNGIVYEGLFFNLKMYFFLPCLKSLFQEDFSKSLESSFEGITKKKGVGFWSSGKRDGKQCPKVRVWIIQVKQILAEVNLRCWTIVLVLGKSCKAG